MNQKGTAAKKRQEKRDELTSSIIVGSLVYCPLYGLGTVTKINSKTINLKMVKGDTEIIQVDKSYCVLPENWHGDIR